VGVLEAGFVGDLLVAEVVAEPGDGLLKAEGVQGGVADGSAGGGARFFGEEIPEWSEIFAFYANVGGTRVGERFSCDGAGIASRFISLAMDLSNEAVCGPWSASEP
jgi:hypothetical protein